MRQRVLILATSLLPPILATNVAYSPFSKPVLEQADGSPLAKRQGCQSGYNACSNLGADEACCPPDTSCTLDQVGHVACCPVNAACTGTVDVTITGTVSASSLPTGSTSTTGIILGTTSTTAFQSFGTLTGVEGGYSTVPYSLYNFIYIPTSYANADLCFTAFSQASAQSTACLTSLAGVNGVTVSGVGFGITVAGASGTVISAAASICSSLSSRAVYGSQSDVCSSVGGGVTTGVATDSTGGLVPQNAMPRQTACPGFVYAAGAGAVMGAMGAFI